jgi:plasmid maintenance system killer protein
LQVANLRIRFQKAKVRRLFTGREGEERYPPGVVDAFFEVMWQIEAASDERDLRKMQNLRLEKLKGKRGSAGQYSMRLTKQMRMVVTFEEDDKGRLVCIREIVDYH